MEHVSVLLHELVDGISPVSGDVVLDATMNGGGHSEEVLRRLGASISVVGIDADGDALERARTRLHRFGADVRFLNGNYRDLDTLLGNAGIEKIDRAMFDLGLSSHQLEESGRGFSFKKDEPLLMTFAHAPKEGDVTAYSIVNGWSESDLADVIFRYGEERYSRMIARRIVWHRREHPIATTGELSSIIEAAVPPGYRHGRIHPATRTFQALRIAVNDELRGVEEGIAKAFEKLSVGGRIGVISFHSLEDRIVKHYFISLEKDERAVRVNKKPIIPSDSEIQHNPRARSAKLRVIEKLK